MRILLLVLSILLPLTSFNALADDAAAPAPATGGSTQQIENTVHQYLIKKPEVVVEALQAYQQKQMQSMEKVFKDTQKQSPKFAQALFRDAGDPVVGDPKGKITLVEFSDYQCPHCIETAPVVEELMKTDPTLRVVIKEFPIRGAISEMAAKAAIAAYKQNKYWAFRAALFKESEKGPLSEEKIMAVAKAVDLNLVQLQKDMADPATVKAVQNTKQLAQDLKLIGTPAFFVARTDIQSTAPAEKINYIPGFATAKQLQDVVAKLAKS